MLGLYYTTKTIEKINRNHETEREKQEGKQTLHGEGYDVKDEHGEGKKENKK